MGTNFFACGPYGIEFGSNRKKILAAGIVTKTNILWSVAAFFLALAALALPGRVAASCLSDADLGAVTRSVFTKSLGPVMRVCAKNYPEIEERALDATRELFITYRKDMRHNRLKTNEIFRRVFEADWQSNLAALLDEATGPIVSRAGKFSAEQCTSEIQRLEVMVNRLDYNAIMATGAARKMF